MSIRVKGPKL